MREILASSRGLLSGWLIAATIPLLINPHTIAGWSTMGLGDLSRIALASTELLGAALFAFERPIKVGIALLMASFIFAATIHLHIGRAPWGLLFYLIAGIVLLYLTRRQLRSGPAQSRNFV